MKTAILFGSIGTILETSDIQRRAYNRALKEAGLPWDWDHAIYAELLEQSGGKDRLAMLSAATGQPLSQTQIDTIHARKTELACAEIVASQLSPRPGVLALIQIAKQREMKLAFVTTTYQANIDAVFAALGDQLRPGDFDFIAGQDAVAHGKPAPDAYRLALTALGIAPSDAVAIEDTALSVMSAKRAGICTIATPGLISGRQDFWQADLVIPALADCDGVIDARLLALLD
ncbi:MAG: HAD-IA family hydrolase [Parasphingorhabdus sp.]|nr:HAD-IA family hydrolase [Parasphingorhabdus sp.]